MRETILSPSIIERALSWFRGLYKKRLPAETLAKGLYDVFIQERSAEQLAAQWVPSPIHPKLISMIERYQKALVLMVLISESQRRSEFEGVLQAYERLVFGPTPNSHGLLHLKYLNAAISDLENLVAAAQSKNVTSLELLDLDSGTFKSRGNVTNPHVWGVEWFRKIGQDIDEPVTPMLFSLFWVNEYVAITEAIRKFRVL